MVASACCAAVYFNTASAQDFPESYDIAESSTPYFLELIVNQRRTGQIIPIGIKQSSHWISRHDLLDTGITIPQELSSRLQAGPEINLNNLPGVNVEYHSAAQQLSINVPSQWLPDQAIDFSEPIAYTPSQTSSGLALNYDLYLSSSENGTQMQSLFSDIRWFGEFGSIDSTHSFQRTDISGSDTTNEFTRFDTTWSYLDQENALLYSAGDFISHSTSWSRPARMAGLQISKSFSVRPDIISYPLPDIIADAEVPTVAELLINGHRAGEKNIQPGPFSLNDIPFVNGAGNATLITKGASGQQIITEAAFYVSPQLLRSELMEYSVSAGFIRHDYGKKSFSYGDPGASASVRYGLFDWLTLESNTQVTPEVNVLGVGSVLGIGTLGTINLSISQSDTTEVQGNSYSVGYEYTNQSVSVGVNHQQRDSDFYDLAQLQSGGTGRFRSSTRYFGNLRLNDYGSVSLSYIDHDRNFEQTKLLNLIWSKTVKQSSIAITASHEIGQSWKAGINYTLQLGNRTAASANASYSEEEGLGGATTYRRSVPSNGGWGWNLAQRRLSNQFSQQIAEATWRGQHTQIQAGTYNGESNSLMWGQATGSLIWMENRIFTSNRLGNSFALVSSAGKPGLPVYYENQEIGVTDADGFLLIPWGSSYYPASYSIDPLNLPANIVAESTQQKHAIKPGAGLLIEFNLLQSLSAIVHLIDSEGNDLPIGSIANIQDEVERIVIGYDGLAFFTDLAATNIVDVALPGGAVCTATFHMETENDSIANIGPVPCQ